MPEALELLHIESHSVLLDSSGKVIANQAGIPLRFACRVVKA